MRRTSWQLLGMAVLAGTGLTTRAHGAIIFGETATASTSIGTPFDRGHLHAVDDSGLSASDGSLATADQSHSNVPDGTMWLSSGNDFGGQDFNPTYTVDLNGVYDVSGIRIWNYNEDSGNPGLFTLRGVRQTNVLVSLDGSNFTNLGLFTIPIADGSNAYAGTFFDVLLLNGGNPLRFRYFQFDIQNNHGGDNNFYGLSEVMFEGQFVPEPGSALLMALAMTGLLARRRRS